METEEEWRQKIEEREHKIIHAFFVYSHDNGLPVFNNSYYFARQILPDECILLKHCIITCLIKKMFCKFLVKSGSLRIEVPRISTEAQPLQAQGLQKPLDVS
jgi:hypothetical protein